MRDIRDRYRAAPDFGEYLEGVEKNRDLWHAVYRRARVPDDLREQAEGLGDTCHLLALSEDWCGDAVNVLPVVARLAEAAPEMELRILDRDDNPDIMDAHLTGGVSRSIPIVILLDEDFEERGWWGPRPAVLQEWVLSTGASLPKDERYKEVRRWFARDRGRTTIEELLELVESCCTTP